MMTPNRGESDTQPCSVFVTMFLVFVFATALLTFEETEFAAIFPSATSLNANVAEDHSDRHDEHDEEENK